MFLILPHDLTDNSHENLFSAELLETFHSFWSVPKRKRETGVLSHGVMTHGFDCTEHSSTSWVNNSALLAAYDLMSVWKAD